jgi:hypothetical protein
VFRGKTSCVKVEIRKYEEYSYCCLSRCNHGLVLEHSILTRSWLLIGQSFLENTLIRIASRTVGQWKLNVDRKREEKSDTPKMA